jgi:hypothetical protein
MRKRAFIYRRNSIRSRTAPAQDTMVALLEPFRLNNHYQSTTRRYTNVQHGRRTSDETLPKKVG